MAKNKNTIVAGSALDMAHKENTDEIKYFYLCGVRISKNKRDMDFWFPYTDDELKAAMMEEIQYNSATEDERKEMTLEHKQKFSQGFLLAVFRKRMEDVKICLFKSKEKLTKKDIETKLHALDTEKLKDSEIPI